MITEPSYIKQNTLIIPKFTFQSSHIQNYIKISQQNVIVELKVSEIQQYQCQQFANLSQPNFTKIIIKQSKSSQRSKTVINKIINPQICNLKQLVLRNSNIDSIEFIGRLCAPALQKLDLTMNKITSIRPLRHFYSLQMRQILFSSNYNSSDSNKLVQIDDMRQILSADRNITLYCNSSTKKAGINSFIMSMFAEIQILEVEIGNQKEQSWYLILGSN